MDSANLALDNIYALRDRKTWVKVETPTDT